MIIKHTNAVSNVISANTARTQFGQILERASKGHERFLVDRRGEPSVIIMSVRDYIENIAPPTPALKAIRADAKKKGTSSLSMSAINRIVATVRKQHKAGDKTKRTKP